MSLPQFAQGHRRSDWLFLGLATVAFVAAMAAGYGQTFYRDDWEFITSRGGWNLDVFMRPHNGHWSAGALLIFKPLLATVGLHSYVPYQVALLVLHVVVAAALFTLVRREAGAYVAIAAGLVFLFLGSGGENLVWPAEIGWNLAAAAGAWALVLAWQPGPIRRPIVVAALLVLAVASSGVGLSFVAVVLIVMLLSGSRRRQLWVVVPAIVAYLAWFVLDGRAIVTSGAFGLANLQNVPEYVAAGVGNALGRTTGWGDVPGMMFAVVLAVATLWRLLGPRPVLVGAVVGIVGVLTQFVVTGIARAGLGTEQAASAHYVYVAAFFLLLALGSWLSLLHIDGRRRRPLAVLGVLTAVALAANLVALVYTSTTFTEATLRSRATVTVLTRFGGSPAVPIDRRIHPIPGPAKLNQVFAQYGSLLSDALAPAPAPSDALLDAALFEAVQPDLEITTADVPAGTEPPLLTQADDAAAIVQEGCLLITPSGEAPTISGQVDGGRSLYLESSVSGTARLLLSYFTAPSPATALEVPLAAGSAVVVAMPDLATNNPWNFRFDPPAAGTARICEGPATSP